MLIDVSKLKRTPGTSQNFRLEEPLNSIGFGSDKLDFEGSVKVDIEATNFDGRISLTGDVNAVVVLQCSRCLKDFRLNLETSFEKEFRTESSPMKERDESLLFKGETIDLTEVIVESILLELPMKHICHVECKGLCNVCGIDLNENSCSCEKEDIDPRLEALKNFFKT